MWVDACGFSRCGMWFSVYLYLYLLQSWEMGRKREVYGWS